MSKSQVSVVRCPDYDRIRIKESVQALLAPLGGMRSFTARPNGSHKSRT